MVGGLGEPVTVPAGVSKRLAGASPSAAARSRFHSAVIRCRLSDDTTKIGVVLRRDARLLSPHSVCASEANARNTGSRGWGAPRRAEACPEEFPLDNARELILVHAAASREVVVNPKLHPCARRWSFQVRARARNRPRTEISSLPATSAGAFHFGSFWHSPSHLWRGCRLLEPCQVKY
jgi:hypothetical protein